MLVAMNMKQPSFEPSQDKTHDYFELGAPLGFSILENMRPLPEEEYRKRLFEWLQSAVDLLEMENRIDEKIRADLRKVFIETIQKHNINYATYRPNEQVAMAIHAYLGQKRSEKLYTYRQYANEVARLGTNLTKEIEELQMTEEDIALNDLLISVGIYDASLSQ